MFPVLAAATSSVVVHGSRFAGKTTLVRSWLATNPVPDADVVFVAPPVASETADEYLTRMSAAVQAHPRRPDKPVLLVLDGAPPSAMVVDGVRELLSGAPQLRIVVTTRVRGSWCELADVRSGGVVVGPEDLSFVVGETVDDLERRGVQCDLRSAQWITRRTGGLPALVAAVAAAMEPGGGEFDSWAVGHDDVIDAAVDRAVRHTFSDDATSGPVGALVAPAAAVDPLTADLVAAVPGVTDGAGFLDALEAAGLVETASGEDAGRRFPDAVRASLLRIAAADHADLLHATRAALIRYRLDAAEPHAALEIAVDAEDWSVVLDIVGEHWTALYTGGFLDTLDSALIERIPNEIARDHPTIVAIRRLHRQFAAPRDVPVVAPGPAAEAETGSTPAEVMMRAMGLRVEGRFTEAAAVCDTLASDPVPVFDELDEHLRPAYAFLYLHIGITYQLVDRVNDAVAMFRRAHLAGAGMFVERDAAGKLALAYALRGACADARPWLDEEQRHPPLAAESERLVRTAGMVAAALMALDRLEPDLALAVLTDLGMPADNEEYWAFVLYAHGQHALLTGMPADGLQQIDHHLRRFPTLSGDGAVAGPLLDAVRADLNLALGDVAAARRLVGQSTHPLTAAARARIHLLTADPAAAEKIVDRYRASTSSTARDSTELAVIGAAAACASGNRSGARRHLNRAIALSRYNGLLRPFASIPPSMLNDVAMLGVDLPVDVRTVTSEFVVFEAAVPGIRLTKQERVVLSALATGQTIAAIAKGQFVSVNTVKSQARSLYRKLGVHSRADAVAFATRANLLPRLDTAIADGPPVS